jgi:hypothetical protein
MTITNSVLDIHDSRDQAEHTIKKSHGAGIEMSGLSAAGGNTSANDHSVGYYYVSVGQNHSVPEAIAVLKFRHECKARWSGAWSKLGEQCR